MVVDDGGMGYGDPTVNDGVNIPTIRIVSPSTYSGGYQAQAVAVMSEYPDPNTGTWYITGINVLVSGFMYTEDQIQNGDRITGKPFITISPPPGGPYARTPSAHAVPYPIYYTVVAATEPAIDFDPGLPSGTVTSILTIDESLSYTYADPGATINFYQVSRIITSSHCFEFIGTGTDIATAIPARGGVPVQANEVVMTNGGKVAYTSTDHLGNFRIGPELVINQDTGTLSGRTFEKSLFAIMTPYLLAIEGI
jgi:hypothetical protein